MGAIKIISIIPYKVLPAKLGGEKGIALFSEYLAKQIPLIAISTKNNDVTAANNFTVLNIMSNSRIRYVNFFQYFTIRKIIKEQNATHLLIEHPYFGWLAWLIKRTLPVTWVVHSHNMEYMRSKSMGRWWWAALKGYEQWVYHQSDINFFISDDDLSHAVNVLNTDPSKSHSITYGIEIPAIPGDIESSKKFIREKYNIPENEKILLFNGTLSQKANYDAISIILENINPALMENKLQYKIIVCGKDLPESFDELRKYQNVNIIYAGFVDDIDVYFKAANIFLNPITSGGGVKTKAIEAIAMNCTLVSTEFGAVGLKKDVCGKKLQVVADNDWQAFANKVMEHMNEISHTPKSFYDHYYWGNIAKKVVNIFTTQGSFVKSVD